MKCITSNIKEKFRFGSILKLSINVGEDTDDISDINKVASVLDKTLNDVILIEDVSEFDEKDKSEIAAVVDIALRVTLETFYPSINSSEILDLPIREALMEKMSITATTESTKGTDGTGLPIEELVVAPEILQTQVKKTYNMSTIKRDMFGDSAFMLVPANLWMRDMLFKSIFLDRVNGRIPTAAEATSNINQMINTLRNKKFSDNDLALFNRVKQGALTYAEKKEFFKNAYNFKEDNELSRLMEWVFANNPVEMLNIFGKKLVNAKIVNGKLELKVLLSLNNRSGVNYDDNLIDPREFVPDFFKMIVSTTPLSSSKNLTYNFNTIKSAKVVNDRMTQGKDSYMKTEVGEVMRDLLYGDDPMKDTSERINIEALYHGIFRMPGQLEGLNQEVLDTIPANFLENKSFFEGLVDMVKRDPTHEKNVQAEEIFNLVTSSYLKVYPIVSNMLSDEGFMEDGGSVQEMKLGQMTTYFSQFSLMDAQEDEDGLLVNYQSYDEIGDTETKSVRIPDNWNEINEDEFIEMVGSILKGAPLAEVELEHYKNTFKDISNKEDNYKSFKELVRKVYNSKGYISKASELFYELPDSERDPKVESLIQEFNTTGDVKERDLSSLMTSYFGNNPMLDVLSNISKARVDKNGTLKNNLNFMFRPLVMYGSFLMSSGVKSTALNVLGNQLPLFDLYNQQHSLKNKLNRIKSLGDNSIFSEHPFLQEGKFKGFVMKQGVKDLAEYDNLSLTKTFEYNFNLWFNDKNELNYSNTPYGTFADKPRAFNVITNMDEGDVKIFMSDYYSKIEKKITDKYKALNIVPNNINTLSGLKQHLTNNPVSRVQLMDAMREQQRLNPENPIELVQGVDFIEKGGSLTLKDTLVNEVGQFSKIAEGIENDTRWEDYLDQRKRDFLGIFIKKFGWNTTNNNLESLEGFDNKYVKLNKELKKTIDEIINDPKVTTELDKLRARKNAKKILLENLDSIEMRPELENYFKDTLFNTLTTMPLMTGIAQQYKGDNESTQFVDNVKRNVVLLSTYTPYIHSELGADEFYYISTIDDLTVDVESVNGSSTDKDYFDGAGFQLPMVNIKNQISTGGKRMGTIIGNSEKAFGVGENLDSGAISANKFAIFTINNEDVLMSMIPHKTIYDIINEHKCS